MIGPDPKDTLSERDFIDDGQPKDPTVMWFWLFFVVALIALLWGVGSQYAGFIQEKTQTRPFLQVTNRDMSLFLWQHPQLMRANRKRKSGYLPAFEYLSSVTVDPKLADLYASAPPELLFRYHTWNRLLRGNYFPRPIPMREFAEFLEYDQQWHPRYWPDAPKQYRNLVESLDPVSEENLDLRPEWVLPLAVKQAFQGWRNYIYEGEAINSIQPSVKDMRAFIAEHPEYRRSLWMNIVDDGRVRYLSLLVSDDAQPEEQLPVFQLSPFLRVAYFNFLQTKEE